MTTKTKTRRMTLSRLMQERGLGPQELAERAGVGRSSLWRWMHGRAEPRNFQAKQLAEALGVSVTSLLLAISASRREAASD